MLKITDHLRHCVSQEDIEALLTDYKEENGECILGGYIHEFIDRTHVITNMIERELALHPAVLYSEEAQELLSQTLTSLYNLYQVVGSLSGDCDDC